MITNAMRVMPRGKKIKRRFLIHLRYDLRHCRGSCVVHDAGSMRQVGKVKVGKWGGSGGIVGE